MTEWFANEQFWEAMYPHMFSEGRFAAAANELEQVFCLAGSKPAAVLDLCCGPGRHAIALAKDGIAVTAVDRSEFLLTKARAYAAQERVEPEFVHADMRDFVRPNTYDLALSMFTSFGYFDDPEDDKAVLANIFDSLRPGGKVLIDVVGKEELAKRYVPSGASEQPDGTKLIQIHEIFADWSKIRNKWLLIKGNEIQEFAFHHSLYSAKELKDLLCDVGFTDVHAYGSLDGNPYDHRANRLIVVGTRDHASAPDH